MTWAGKMVRKHWGLIGGTVAGIVGGLAVSLSGALDAAPSPSVPSAQSGGYDNKPRPRIVPPFKTSPNAWVRAVYQPKE